MAPRCITAIRAQICAVTTRKSCVMNSIESQAAPEVFEEFQDLRLHGYVKCRDGFVGDENLGVECQRAGDPDPLPLAAGKFMRKTVHRARIEAYQAQQVVDALPRSRGGDAMRDRAVRDDVAYLAAWIERGELPGPGISSGCGGAPGATPCP